MLEMIMMRLVGVDTMESIHIVTVLFGESSGFDIYGEKGTPKAIPHNNNDWIQTSEPHDFMSYGKVFKWISDYTYKALLATNFQEKKKSAITGEFITKTYSCNLN